MKHRCGLIFARLVLGLTLLGMVLAPSLVHATAKQLREQPAAQGEGCCKAKLTTEASKDHPASPREEGCCKGGCFGCCLATFSAGFVLDRSADMTVVASASPRLLMTGAQASVPASAFLDSIFHPPRA